MLRKWGTLVLFLLAAPVLVFAQSTGKLAGQVVDASTGDPLPGASVVIVGTQLGTAADVDGNYTILGVPVGSHDVQASFVGFSPQVIEGVKVSSGYTQEVNFSLQPGTELGEIVVEYERPLIQKDAIGAPKVVDAEEIQNIPIRGVAGVAALQGGVISNDNSSNLFVRGGREEQVVYFVDGVKVLGGLNTLGVPTQAIQEQEMLIGSIPARFGDAMSGVVSITTKSGAPNFFGTVEGITSEALDPWGFNQGSISIGGPIVQSKLNFFASLQGTKQSDTNLWAIDQPHLPSDIFNSFQDAPQAFQIEDADGNIDYLPIPGNLPEGMTVDDFLAENLPEGFDITSEQLIDRASLVTANDVTFRDKSDSPQDDIDFTGNLTFFPTESISLRFGGTYSHQNNEGYNLGRSFFNRNNAGAVNETGRIFGTWRQHLSASTFYQLQAEYSHDYQLGYSLAFGKDIENIIRYGDIDDPANAVAAGYKVIGTDADGNDVFDQRGEDGTFTGAIGSAIGLWALPGVVNSTYNQLSQNQFRLTANATTQVGLHQIEFGGEFEQTTQRFWNIGGGQARQTARFICDDPEAANCGAEAIDPTRETGVNSYAELPANAFNPGVGVAYWGYDFRGLNKVDDQNPHNFVLPDCGEGVTDKCYTGEDKYDVAPWQPFYYAGYLQDKIEYKDLVLNLGLRVDVFDSNTLVLDDQFAFKPIYRVGDVGGQHPANIGSDYAVYYAGTTDQIVGYRNKRGEYFDANGQETTLMDLRDLEGRQRLNPDKNFEDVFTDYEPQVTVMPRIGISFPVTDRALFFASYNVTSQRPKERQFLPFTAYANTSGQSRNNNPNLKPETTIQYELGFRQRLGARAALQISGFLRNQNNMVQIRNIVGAYPETYGSHLNIDFATTKGVELEFDLRRTNNVSFRANYTFSVAQGTGSDGQTLRTIQWLTNNNYFPNFISPMAFDQRHALNLTLDYRLGEGEGPMLGGAHFLENFGVNVVGQFGSGMPYTALSRSIIITNQQVPGITGGINSQRLPWKSLVNLRVDRRFQLGNKTSLTAFVWVQNLLNTDNWLSVYRATGLPNTDGFLATQGGQNEIANATAGLGDPLGGEAYEFLYSTAVDAPTPQGGNHGGGAYSVPRRTRVGLRLNF